MSVSPPALIAFTDPVTPSHDHPRPDRLVLGNPLRTTWDHFTDGSGQFNAGTWACEVGAWNIAFADNKEEFFCVLSGRLRITDSRGLARDFGPGDACVIPAGFTGCFEVLEPVRKHFVILERAG